MRKILCVMLALLMLLPAFAVCGQAASNNAKQTKRTIAIVFDNSGSMYLANNGDEEQRYAWCRATYAMEAFATMMNETDTMSVYPMHPVEVNGKRYDASKPLTVSQKTASTIRDLYTPNPAGTPLETIGSAFADLSKKRADERWLIVLTDGDSFYKGGADLGGKSLPALEAELKTCSEKVNVMYLGIGKGALLPELSGTKKEFVADKANSSTQVLEKLTAMCNTIFGRDTLQNVDKKVNFDVSMSKLIVFIQGSGIKNVKLGDQKPASVSNMKYATKGGGGQGKGEFRVDKSLQGALLTYTDLDAGEYALSYSGSADSVVCYYEPDVDLFAQMLDATGKPVSTDSDLTAGTYTLQYHIVDKNGEEVTSSLLGETKYEVTYTINGEEKTVTADKGGVVELEMQPNDEIDVDFKVTYLGGYTITRDSGDLGWPKGGLKFLPPPAGLLEAKLTGGASEYSLSKLSEGEKFRVEFIYQGVTCTDVQLDRIEAAAKVNEANVGCKIDRDDQGYFVSLDYYKTPLETDCGNFELHVTGVYTNEDNLQTNIALAKADFSLKDDSRTLEMTVLRDQSYYQISKIADGKPVIVDLRYSGDKLTEEEMKGIQLTCDSSDVPVILEPDYANSCYKVRFDPQNPPAKGNHTLQFTAKGQNEIGREMNVSKATKVEFCHWPMWLRILLPIVILLFLALLFWLYMKQPVLPKRIDVQNVQYMVDGELLTGNVHPHFTGAGKKTGEIKIFSPKCTTDPMAEQGIVMSLQAVTPRYVKSKQRKASVQYFKLKNSAHVLSARLKTSTFAPNPEKPQELLLTTTGKPMVKPIEIGNNTPIEMVSDTGMTSSAFQCKLQFK